ncbi:MAG: acyl carrier protein [Planctomycetota bacterium]
MPDAAQTRIAAFLTNDILVSPTDSLDPQQPLLTSGLVDSMGVMRLVQFLEEEFRIQIDPADVTIENFGCLNDITTFVANRQSS